jgi:hypothetical protein
MGFFKAKEDQFFSGSNERGGSLPDRRLIRSLSAFSLAKEDQANENA